MNKYNKIVILVSHLSPNKWWPTYINIMGVVLLCVKFLFIITFFDGITRDMNNWFAEEHDMMFNPSKISETNLENTISNIIHT